MTTKVRAARVNADVLRDQIRDKYTDVALTPEQGFHFHAGRPLARMLGYDDALLEADETVLDIGSGAGFDSLISARQVGPGGRWNWVLDNVGFENVRWGQQADVFSGSKHESDAAEFDTRGVTFTASKQ